MNTGLEYNNRKIVITPKNLAGANKKEFNIPQSKSTMKIGKGSNSQLGILNDTSLSRMPTMREDSSDAHNSND